MKGDIKLSLLSSAAAKPVGLHVVSTWTIESPKMA